MLNSPFGSVAPPQIIDRPGSRMSKGPNYPTNAFSSGGNRIHGGDAASGTVYHSAQS